MRSAQSNPRPEYLFLRVTYLGSNREDKKNAEEGIRTPTGENCPLAPQASVSTNSTTSALESARLSVNLFAAEAVFAAELFLLCFRALLLFFLFFLWRLGFGLLFCCFLLRFCSGCGLSCLFFLFHHGFRAF